MRLLVLVLCVVGVQTAAAQDCAVSLLISVWCSTCNSYNGASELYAFPVGLPDATQADLRLIGRRSQTFGHWVARVHNSSSGFFIVFRDNAKGPGIYRQALNTSANDIRRLSIFGYDVSDPLARMPGEYILNTTYTRYDSDLAIDQESGLLYYFAGEVSAVAPYQPGAVRRCSVLDGGNDELVRIMDEAPDWHVEQSNLHIDTLNSRLFVGHDSTGLKYLDLANDSFPVHNLSSIAEHVICGNPRASPDSRGIYRVDSSQIVSFTTADAGATWNSSVLPGTTYDCCSQACAVDPIAGDILVGARETTTKAKVLRMISGSPFQIQLLFDVPGSEQRFVTGLETACLPHSFSQTTDVPTTAASGTSSRISTTATSIYTTATATMGTTAPATPGTTALATPGTTALATPGTTALATPGTTAIATSGTSASPTPSSLSSKAGNDEISGIATKSSNLSPWLFLAGGAVVVLCLVVIGAYIGTHHKRTRRVAAEFVLAETESQETSSPNSESSFTKHSEHLPQSSDLENQKPEERQLDSIWAIPYEDITTVEEIGAGAFGVVFRGRWRESEVAVKQLLPETTTTVAASKMDFQAEASLMAALRPHNNIVRFLGVCTNFPWCLVTEYVSGGSLHALLSRMHDEQNFDLLSQTDIEDILRGVASGMLHLSLEGVVHRDLAARNVLLARSHHKYLPKITDFGLSRILAKTEASEGLEAAGKTTSLNGPLKWMAPECLRDRIYSEKSDVYAFGVLTVELLTVDVPFPGLDPMQAVSRVIAGDVHGPPLNERGQQNLTPAISRFLEHCFDPDPLERPSFANIVHFLPNTFADNSNGANVSSPDLSVSLNYTFLVQSHGSQLGDGLVKKQVQTRAIPKREISVFERIARGSFGEVWRGDWNGTPVAVKRLRHTGADEFAREIEMLGLVQHPHCVSYFGVWNSTEKSCPGMCLVMEWCNGGSLRDMLVTESKLDSTGTSLGTPPFGRFVSADLVGFGLHAATGLAYLASRRLVHADVALRNLLCVIGAGDKILVKLADFGLAKVLESDEENDAAAKRPVKWSAPEVTEFGRYGIKSDVWSLGVCLHEMFSMGAAPYQGLSNAEVIEKVRDGYRLPAPRDCPDDMYEVMMDCWQTDHSRRPSQEDIRIRLSVLFRDMAAGQELLAVSLLGPANWSSVAEQYCNFDTSFDDYQTGSPDK